MVQWCNSNISFSHSQSHTLFLKCLFQVEKYLPHSQGKKAFHNRRETINSKFPCNIFVMHVFTDMDVFSTPPQSPDPYDFDLPKFPFLEEGTLITG